MTRKEILDRLNIRPGDKVLEIGSGPMPFERADVLADKYIYDDTQRCAPIVIDRPFVVCDAQALPFKDKSFDYIFCSQLLEHLDNPEAFFKEIMRVGKRGYIETPNELREKFQGWPFHKWVVSVDGDTLVLRKKNFPLYFGDIFHDLRKYNRPFSYFCDVNHTLFNVCFEWEGEIKYRIEEPVSYDENNPSLWLEKLNITEEDMRLDHMPGYVQDSYDQIKWHFVEAFQRRLKEAAVDEQDYEMIRSLFKESFQKRLKEAAVDEQDYDIVFKLFSRKKFKVLWHILRRSIQKLKSVFTRRQKG
jgi:SAM-dependent methyltransferase